MEETILKVENVSKTFGTGEAMNKVLDNVSLEIKKGEFASLMGSSGSGKSTLLYLIGGLDTSYDGNIYICGQKMTGMKESQMSALRLAKIGFIFQFLGLLLIFYIVWKYTTKFKQVNNLIVEQELMSKELQIASDIQSAMLPSILPLPENPRLITCLSSFLEMMEG